MGSMKAGFLLGRRWRLIFAAEIAVDGVEPWRGRGATERSEEDDLANFLFGSAAKDADFLFLAGRSLCHSRSPAEAICSRERPVRTEWSSARCENGGRSLPLLSSSHCGLSSS